MSITRSTHTFANHSEGCTNDQRITKSLLAYGVVVGPVYVATSLVQALMRDGFDLTRHEWSLLVNGDYGWIQIANLVLAGLMTLAFAMGLRRALGTGRGARWGPRFVAAYGISLVAAGAFRADPALAFPIGTPDGPGPISWHGMLHLVAGGVGFTCISVACFVLARRYSLEGRRGWATFSQLTAVLFLAGFAVVVSGQVGATVNLSFTAAVLLLWGWMAAVAADRYRAVGRAGSTETRDNA